MQRSALQRRLPARPIKDRSDEYSRFVPRAREIARPQVDSLPAPPAPVSKRIYVRNKRLREAYRLLPCQFTNDDGSLCGVEDGTVCCAHLNLGWAGKGMALKASDDYAASACFRHHMLLDQGGQWSGEEKERRSIAAHVRSVRLLVRGGHWPQQVPIPLHCLSAAATELARPAGPPASGSSAHQAAALLNLRTGTLNP